MTAIVLAGEAAEAERKRLFAEGTEIPVAVHARNAHGKKTTLWMHLGMNASTAWIACREEQEGAVEVDTLEAVLKHEAEGFFAEWIERLLLRKGLVNSSPLSPELCEIQPCLEHVVDALRAEFRIEVSAWGLSQLQLPSPSSRMTSILSMSLNSPMKAGLKLKEAVFLV